jgi:hypothetical protein
MNRSVVCLVLIGVLVSVGWAQPDAELTLDLLGALQAVPRQAQLNVHQHQVRSVLLCHLNALGSRERNGGRLVAQGLQLSLDLLGADLPVSNN